MTNRKHGVWWLPLVISSGACSKEPETFAASKASAPPISVEPIADPRPAPPPAPSPTERLLATPDYASALEQTLPAMSDTDEDLSTGAVMFALWSAKHLRWADVGVAKNETSAALVRKDSDAHRGKRMCVRGQIIQIAKQKVDTGSVFSGLMLSGYTELTKFVVAGSTGDLVEHSGARLCGVVTGTYDYSNSAGGKGHAISIVGMFDLPENRKAK